MKKEEFLKVISEKDNDQNVNELIGEIEEHVFRYIKYGTRSNVFNLVETCYDDVKSMIVSETLKNYSVGRFMDLTYFVALCDLYFKNKSVLSERHDFEKALKDRRELAAIISFIVEEKHHVTLEDLCSHFEKENGKILQVDICGECDPDKSMESPKNDHANKELLRFWKKWF